MDGGVWISLDFIITACTRVLRFVILLVILTKWAGFTCTHPYPGRTVLITCVCINTNTLNSSFIVVKWYLAAKPEKDNAMAAYYAGLPGRRPTGTSWIPDQFGLLTPITAWHTSPPMIRPLPKDLPPYLRRVRLCDGSKCRGPIRCTYAHNEFELNEWNRQLQGISEV